MSTAKTFTLSAETRLLSAAPKSLDVLAECIRAGRSVRTCYSDAASVVPVDSQNQVLLCQTSGSAGGAKTIRRKPQSWIRSFEINGEMHGFGPRDAFAVLGQLGHSLSLYATLEAFHWGADIAVMAGQLPRSQALRMSEQRVSVLYATPSQLRLLAAGAAAAGVPYLADMRRVFSGGGKLTADLRARLRQVFPNAAIHEFFGAGETSFIAISDAATPEGSVGRAYPGVTLRIGQDPGSKPGETDEIWVKSPYLFDGYDGAGSAETRREGAYLSIGEMGFLDSRGYLFPRGRKTRMVTVADKNVFPEEIETLIEAAPGIDLCAAIDLPDIKRGHRIVCVIEGRANSHLEKSLRRKCHDELGAHAVPHDFCFLDRLPLLPAGKPDLQALRQQLSDRS